MCLDLWGRQGGASLQALHFSFAVGAFIVPLVIQPFFVGLQQLELHNNLSDGQDLPTTDTTDVLMLVRGLRNVNPTADSVGTPFTDLESYSYEEIKNMTYPKENIPREDPCLLNNTSNLNSYVKAIDSDNETSTSPEITSVIPVSTVAADIPSTPKTPKMKPSYTDANILEPEGQVWRKPQAVEYTKTKTNSPDLVESKKHSLDQSTTSHSPSDVETISVKTTLVETAETTAVPVKLTTHPSMITQQVMNGTSENQTYSTSIPVAVEVDVASEKSEASPATLSTPTIIPTSSSATFRTTAYTTKPPQVTTVTPAPVVITPSPKPLNMNKYEISFQDDDDRENLQGLEIDMTGETVSLLNSNGMTDSKEKLEQGDEIIENDDDNALIPEPELLDLKEPVKDGAADPSMSDDPSKSDIPSIKHHLFKPGTFSNGSDDGSPFLDNMAQRFKEYGVTKVHLAYICIGIFIILNALISVVILCHNPRETRSKQDDGNMGKMQKGRVILFTIIFSVFMFMAEALQGAVHHLLASSSTGTGLTIIQDAKIDGQVLFWGLVCLVRFLCILVSGCLHIKPGKLLVISVLFSLIGSIFLAIGSFGKEDFLWGGIIFLALGLAPVLPTSLLWMAQYMRVTHRMCALMIIVASFGNSVTHSLLTRVTGNAHAYAYILVTISFVSLFFLFLSMCILYTAQHSKALSAPVGYQLASQHEEEDSVEFTPSGSVVFKPSDPRVQENGEAGQSLLID